MGETSTIEIQARMRDINAGGHVDNVEAIRVIDEARLRFLLRADGGVLRRLPAGVTNLVASQRVDFRSEMRFAGFQNFEVIQWVGHIGTSSFTVQSELRLPGGSGAAVVAESAVVLFDPATQRSWPITDEVRADLSVYVGAPVALRDRPA